jgi:photosynthetic reaction center H subunit
MALRPISRMDEYTFPPDAWDVRGWSVRTETDDERVGRVDDMLLDHNGMLRYLDVDVGYLKRHVLVPLNHAHADRQSETVRIEGLRKEEMEELPEYALDPETLDADYERRLNAYYASRPRSGSGRIDEGEDLDGELELRRMDTLEDDYEVAGEDPRGWDVVTADGREAGEVAELLMDPGAMKARFLDVVVDEKELELEPVDRHILLPADRVRLDRNNKKVVVSGLLARDVRDYPQYEGMPVRRRAVREVDSFFERAASPAPDRGGDELAADMGDPADPSLRRRGPEDPAVRHFYRSSGRRSERITEEGRHG